MHRTIILALIAAALAAFVYSDRLGPGNTAQEAAPPAAPPGAGVPGTAGTPDRAVLDISVHTMEELQVLLDRAEQLANMPREGDAQASVVLVLHGPEVEFFSTRNYDRYRELVDQAARLDSLDIVDVKICQAMMAERGVARDDIPPFIEQVPLGSAEIERLAGEGYVYF